MPPASPAPTARAQAGCSDSAKSPADLGRDFGASLTEAEVRYLVEQEWARTAEDVVWRRSKLGLRMSAAEIGALDDWMRQFRAATGGSAQPRSGRASAV